MKELKKSEKDGVGCVRRTSGVLRLAPGRSPWHGRKSEAPEDGAAAELQGGLERLTLDSLGTAVVRAFLENQPQRQSKTWQSRGWAGTALGGHGLL